MNDKTMTYKGLIKHDTEKAEREQLEGILHSIVKSENGDNSNSATGGKTTASPTEPTEEDLNRRFMIVENEHGQPEMVEVFFERLDDKDCD